MIIDLFSDGEEIKNLPHFSTKGSVAVSYVSIELDAPLPKGLVTLTSTLVNRNSANPEQQICTFYHQGQSKFAVFEPTRLVYYKMNCFNSFEAVIRIQKEKNKEPEKKRKIENIYLQLDIQSDARLF